MTNKRILFIAILIALIIGVGVGISRITQAQDTPDTTSTESTYVIEDRTIIQTGDLARTVNGTGTISPRREVTLSFQTQTAVTEILVKEGDRVQAGDILARTDARTFDQRLHDAQHQLESAQIAYNDLVGPPRDVDVAAAEASVRSAQLALGPGTALTGPDSVAAQIEDMQLQLALNLNWQVQMRNEDFDPGLDAAWLRLQRYEEGTDEWENARQDYYAAEARETLNQADVQSSQRSIDVARAEYDAEQNRRATYAGSSNAYAQRTQAEIALEDLTGPRDAYDLAYADLDVAIAQANLQYVEELTQQAVLVAPFDGLIVEMNLTQGTLPPANALVLVDDSTYEINVPVDELDIAHVHAAQPVRVEIDALRGEAISGIVDNVALTPTLLGDVVTYNVRIVLDATEVPVRTGMSGRVWIATQSAENALIVPSPFIRHIASINEDVMVVLADDGTLEPRRVQIGIQNTTDSQILSGVDAGEIVVLLSPSDLEQLVNERTQSANLDQQ